MDNQRLAKLLQMAEEQQAQAKQYYDPSQMQGAMSNRDNQMGAMAGMGALSNQDRAMMGAAERQGFSQPVPMGQPMPDNSSVPMIGYPMQQGPRSVPMPTTGNGPMSEQDMEYIRSLMR
jgi:hypothetical protein